jgi:hypothetical protein
MSMSRLPLRTIVLLTLSLIAVPAAAQQTTTAPFEPRVGQAGKDVVWVPTPQVLVDKMLDMAQVTRQSAGRGPSASSTTPTWWRCRPSAPPMPR